MTGRTKKIVLSAALIPLGIGGLALAVINLGLQSSQFQDRLEQKITERIGRPVSISAASFTPWGGLAIHGIAVDSPPPPPDAEQTPSPTTAELPPLLKIKTVRAQLHWPSLWNGQLRIAPLTIDQPHFALPLEAGAAFWALPEKPATPVLEDDKEPKREIEITTEAPPTWSLEEIQMNGGTITFYGSDGKTALRVEGIDILAHPDKPWPARAWSGVATIERVANQFLWSQSVILEWKLEGREFHLTSSRAQIGKGVLRGVGNTNGNPDKNTFSLKLRLENVELAEIFSGADRDLAAVASGIVNGNVDLEGRWDQPATIAGEGSLRLRKGSFIQHPLLQIAGLALQIEELLNLQIERAEIPFQVAEEKVIITGAEATTPNMNLKARGDIHFSSELAIDVSLTLSPQIEKQLSESFLERFQPSEDGKGVVTDFHITGTLDDPQQDLFEERDAKQWLRDWWKPSK